MPTWLIGTGFLLVLAGIILVSIAVVGLNISSTGLDYGSRALGSSRSSNDNKGPKNGSKEDTLRAQKRYRNRAVAGALIFGLGLLILFGAAVSSGIGA